MGPDKQPATICPRPDQMPQSMPPRPPHTDCPRESPSTNGRCDTKRDGYAAPSVDPAALVWAVETEGRDRDVEILTRRGYHHMIRPDHEARWRVQRGAGGIFEAFPRFEQRLLTDHAGAV